MAAMAAVMANCEINLEKYKLETQVLSIPMFSRIKNTISFYYAVTPPKFKMVDIRVKVRALRLNTYLQSCSTSVEATNFLVILIVIEKK